MNNFDNYLHQVISFNNPVIYSIIFSFLIVILMLLFFLKIVFPMRLKFYREKQNLILEQTKLMALFAELDPDPSLRCDASGAIIQTNDASRKLFSGLDLTKSNIRNIIPGFDSELKDFIANNRVISFFESLRNKVFLVNVKGISEYNFANIYMNDITQMKEYETKLEEYKEKLRTLADRLESRFEKQRKQLSSELHDDIGQKLVLLKLKLNQLDMESRNLLLSDLEEVYTRIREISHVLKPAEIDELGLKFSLQNLVEKVTTDSGLKGYFSYLGPEEKYNPEIEMCLYRTAQEAVTNILKHAEAKEFSIQLMNINGSIEMIISDDGKGIPKEYFESKDLKNYGIGLFGMKERLNNLYGTMRINSEPFEGTSIIIKIPKKPEGEQ